jgi:hypothetical protein
MDTPSSDYHRLDPPISGTAHGHLNHVWSDTRRNEPGGKDDNLVEHTRDSWEPADHFPSDLPKLLSLHPAAD